MAGARVQTTDGAPRRNTVALTQDAPPLGAVETEEQITVLHEFAKRMQEAKADLMELLADGLALVYHEARNVRFLIRASVIPATGWEKLVALPTNRVDAWKKIQS